jgi:hypothetical protein
MAKMIPRRLLTAAGLGADALHQKSLRISLAALTLAGSAAGFLLRRYMLLRAYGSDGQMIRGSASIWILGAFCALAVLVLALLAHRLAQRADYESVFSSSGLCLAVSIAAGALTAAGGAAGVLSSPTVLNMALGFLAVAAGICFVAIGAGRFRGAAAGPGVHLLPVVYLVFKLIVDFKHWSIDPAVPDYCFSLFAAIAALFAVYGIAGFCFGKGRRRSAAFWCLAASVLTAVSLADGGAQNLLSGGGMWLWTAANAWQLLED